MKELLLSAACLLGGFSYFRIGLQVSFEVHFGACVLNIIIIPNNLSTQQL